MQEINKDESIARKRRIYFVAEWVDERQELDLVDIGTADTFTLSYKGQTTSAITFSADMSSAIKTALEALSNIEADDISVSKGSGHVYTIRLGGSLVYSGIALLSVTPTGFGSPGPTVERLAYAGSPAEGLVFDPSEIQITKSGAARATSGGTVTDCDYGTYYYECTAAEVDTPGFLGLVTVRDDISVTYPTAIVTTKVARSGLAQGGASDSITLDTNASSVGDFYLPCVVKITAGTGAGQGARYAVDYNGVTRVMTVTPIWVVVPDATSEFEVHDSLPMVQLADLVDNLGDEVQTRVPSTILAGDGSKIDVQDGAVRAARARASTT
jgi:hypothetical protein